MVENEVAEDRTGVIRSSSLKQAKKAKITVEKQLFRVLPPIDYASRFPDPKKAEFALL